MNHRNNILYMFIILFVLMSKFLFAGPLFLVGNRDMLVGASSEGNISFVNWQGIGGSNQIGSYDNSAGLPIKENLFLEPTAFFLKVQDSIYSLTDSTITGKYIKPEIPLIKLKGTKDEGNLAWEEEIFVHPSKNVLFIHFVMEDNIQPYSIEQLISYQNISPSPPPIPESPFLIPIENLRSNFCSFWDMTHHALVHFRPYSLSKTDLQRFEQLNKDSAINPKFWQKFEEGTYIGVSSPNPIEGSAIIDSPPINTTLSEIATRTFPKKPYMLGDTCSAMILKSTHTTESQQVFTIFYAFAKNYSELEELVDWAGKQNYEHAREELINFWQTKWNETKKSIKEDFAHTWLLLSLSSDPSTGAILPNLPEPICNNKLSLQNSFLLVQAMNDMNMLDFSKKLIFFWNNVGKQRKQTAKLTFPLQSYPDGTPATPDYWADISQTVFFISMIYVQNNLLSFTEKKEFLNEVWDVLVWSVDNLCLWKVPGELLPAPSYTSSLNRDVQSANLVIRTLIGIQSGIQLARTAYKPVPEFWEERDREIQTWIRLAILNKTTLKIFPETDFTYWKKFFPNNNPIWKLPVKYNGTTILLKDLNNTTNKNDI